MFRTLLHWYGDHAGTVFAVSLVAAAGSTWWGM